MLQCICLCYILWLDFAHFWNLLNAIFWLLQVLNKLYALQSDVSEAWKWNSWSYELLDDLISLPPHNRFVSAVVYGFIYVEHLRFWEYLGMDGVISVIHKQQNSFWFMDGTWLGHLIDGQAVQGLCRPRHSNSGSPKKGAPSRSNNTNIYHQSLHEPHYVISHSMFS